MEIFLQKCEMRVETQNVSFFPLKILTKCAHVFIAMFYCKEKMYFFFCKRFEFLVIAIFSGIILFVPGFFLFFLITPWRDLFPYQEWKTWNMIMIFLLKSLFDFVLYFHVLLNHINMFLGFPYFIICLLFV